MWINYHHLYYFKTIAEQNSVSRAAEKLNLGQPTLSAQLRQFEDYLGVKLFDRQHKKLILTQQGKLALDYAQEIFNLGSEMVDALQDRKLPEKMRLQIGALDGIPKEFLVELVSFCLKKNSTYENKVNLSFIEGSLGHLIRELEMHQIDLIITNYLPTSQDHKKIYHKLIHKNDVKIYGSAHFKSLKKKFPESLNDQNMILSTYDSQLRSDLDHWFKLRSLKVNVLAETQDMALKKQLALGGFGLVAGTDAAMSAELEQGKIFEIGNVSNVYENIYFLTPDRKRANPVVQYLLKEFA
jgi:LysR family transcriptional activator of nhaA